MIGARPLIEGLTRIHSEGAMFDVYWRQEVVPILQAGYRVPLVEGFARFLRVPRVRTAIDEMVADQLESGTTDPFDSHPPLRERIAAVEALHDNALPRNGDGTSAISLIGNVEASERALVRFAVKAADASALRPLSWDQTTAVVLVPKHRRVAQHMAKLLGPSPTFADLPDVIRLRGEILLARSRPGTPKFPTGSCVTPPR